MESENLLQLFPKMLEKRKRENTVNGESSPEIEKEVDLTNPENHVDDDDDSSSESDLENAPLVTSPRNTVYNGSTPPEVQVTKSAATPQRSILSFLRAKESTRNDNDDIPVLECVGFSEHKESCENSGELNVGPIEVQGIGLMF